MKKKVIMISFFMLFVLGQASYGAIEIVPSKNRAGTDGMVNSSVTNSYLLCQGMKNAGESLYGTTVLPHLATNTDWGAVSYLSNSIYGTNTVGKNTGIAITIDGVKYYSTTGNATGVMNWGANPNVHRVTQTSGLIKAYVDDNSTSTVNANVLELYSNKDTRFVDIINTSSFTANNTLGMAMSEISGIDCGDWKRSGSSKGYPISVRSGLFGFAVGSRSRFEPLWHLHGCVWCGKFLGYI